MKKIFRYLYFISIISLLFCSDALALSVKNSNIGNLLTIPLGYFISLSIHELGHAVVASNVGAEGISFTLPDFKNRDFLGATTKVDKINKESVLPYAMGGEIGADYTFEFALSQYRQKPTLLNKSMLFFSGTDFLKYSIYSLYVDKDNEFADPSIVMEETNFNRNVILSLALIKTAINYNRVVSNNDIIIPYFTYDNNSVAFNISYKF